MIQSREDNDTSLKRFSVSTAPFEEERAFCGKLTFPCGLLLPVLFLLSAEIETTPTGSNISEISGRFNLSGGRRNDDDFPSFEIGGSIVEYKVAGVKEEVIIVTSRPEPLY
ncbi:hypothetical protein Trydic_g6869 [Trypoxylus dichotomus]